MIKQSITIINKLGLHARASIALVKVADRFSSNILITYQNRTLNAKSIMGLLVLGAKQGSVVEFEITGDDEAEAWEAIQTLINQRFGESE